MKLINMKYILSFTFLSLALMGKAQAQGNFATMFASALDSFEALIELTVAVGYVIGIFLFIKGTFVLSNIGGQDPKANMKSVISHYVVGACVIAILSSVNILGNSMTLGADGPGQILAPNVGGGGASAIMQQAMISILTFLRFLGYVAIIRGWLIVNSLVANGQSQGNTMGKGITHIIGGVALVYVQSTAMILSNTFSPNLPTPFGP